MVLKAERVKAGYPEGEVDNLLGADGRLDVTLRFAGLDFVVFVSEDSGEVVPGDAGTLQYDEDGLIMRSNSSGCPSCTYRYHWTLTDPRLVLEITEIIYDPGDGVAVKIVTNNTFTKVD